MSNSNDNLYRLAHERVMSYVLEDTPDFLETLVLNEPHNLTYLVEYAVYMQQITLKEELVSIEERVKEIAPESAEHYFMQALILDVDFAEGALEAYNRVLDLRPDFPHALHLRAEVLRQKGEFDQAAVDLDRCLELEPGYSMSHLMAGNIKERLARYEEALDHLIHYLYSPYALKSQWLYSSIGRLCFALSNQAQLRQEQYLKAQISLDFPA
jgi:tetratricopeptide (TPR) repeat protein